MADFIGILLTIDAIFTWAFASLVYKFGLQKIEAPQALLPRLLLVTLFTFAISLLFGNYLIFTGLNFQQLIDYDIACIISGVTVTIGDLLYFHSLKKIDASRAYPLSSLSLIFVYPFAAIFFGEIITFSILIGGTIILIGSFFLSSKDKPKNEISSSNNVNENSNNQEKKIKVKQKSSEDVFIGVILALGTAFFWALAIVSFNQARIIANGEVFVTNFIRIISATIFISIFGMFKHKYYKGFKKENRIHLKYYIYIGIAGSLSLGFADSLFYKAAEINGLIFTSTITASTPLIQQLASVLILKEKFRKRFLIAVILIILGNYIIIFL
ncbi:hypothetical protein ES706_03617 [subsurface metagenome]